MQRHRSKILPNWGRGQKPGKKLKVSKFQNEFTKSSFLPKYERNIVRISALYCATLQLLMQLDFQRK